MEGEEESGAMLGALAHSFELDRAQRVAHRWTGIAGILGFAEIARQARGIEDFLAEPGGQGASGEARDMIAAGECVSRLRADLLSIRQMFSHAVRGRRETPGLPPAVRQTLANKKFAAIGFERAEAARIKGALEHAWACCHVFQVVPDNGTLQPYHAAVVNVCQGEGIFSWAQNWIAGDSVKPILFVGSAETLLRREAGTPEQNWDFLLGPWDADELIFRAYRLFASGAKRDPGGGSSPRHGDHGPGHAEHRMGTFKMTSHSDGL